MLKYSKIIRLWSTLPALISMVFVPICVPASAEPSTPKSGAQESLDPSRGSALVDEVSGTMLSRFTASFATAWLR